MPKKINTPLNILITGQVDHGKSTLIGRLVYECGQMAPAVKAKLEKIASQQGLDQIEWAFALDSLELERQQGITLDASRVWLKRADREMVLIDVPGHHELLANMLTGASNAEAALMLIDAEEGITQQTRLHARLITLLGIRQLLVVVTKMDRAAYSQSTFEKHCAEAAQMFPELELICIPISAVAGDHLSEASPNMPWYQGQPLLHHMDALSNQDEMPSDQPFRMCVQDVVKADGKRIVTGRITSGSLAVGDSLLACPSGSSADVSAFIGCGEDEKTTALTGESIGITLSQPIFLQRGEVLAAMAAPPLLLHRCRAQVIWLGQTAMLPGEHYALRLGTQSKPITLHVDTPLMRHELGEVEVRSRGLMVVDPSPHHTTLRRFVIENSQHMVVAAGVMLPDVADDQLPSRLARKSENISPYQLPVTPARFEQRNGHKGGVFWLTGLSGSGKSTLAVEMQKALFDQGMQVVILDGDNLRSGLCRDLGFSEDDRRENIRRAAETARLFAQHGNIVITAFITPTAEDRALAANICGQYFQQIYINAGLELCESRDTKGLYKKARSGEIQNFTGISAPFDVPEHADLVVDTSQSVSESIAVLAGFIHKKVAL